MHGLPSSPDREQRVSLETSKDILDAAETIVFCTEHAKRIVDDILVVSKLNSDLLRVSPTPTEPKAAVLQARKIFENQIQVAGINCTVDFHESLSELKVDWVMLDNSRILQILVNLIGNR